MQQLLTQINLYLNGEIDLRRLESWVVGHLQGFLDSHDARSIELADAVDVAMVELGEGIITALEFHMELEALVSRALTHRIKFGELPSPIVVSGDTTSTTVLAYASDRLALVADLRVSHVFA